MKSVDYYNRLGLSFTLTFERSVFQSKSIYKKINLLHLFVKVTKFITKHRRK